ncbi:MAG: hypothetical protein ACO24L_08195, partial [Polynucleobacter sp.]
VPVNQDLLTQDNFASIIRVITNHQSQWQNSLSIFLQIFTIILSSLYFSVFPTNACGHYQFVGIS